MKSSDELPWLPTLTSSSPDNSCDKKKTKCSKLWANHNTKNLHPGFVTIPEAGVQE